MRNYLKLRRKQALKVRQPLKAVMVPVLNDDQRDNIRAVADLITNEVNVKELRLVSDDEQLLVKRVKPDFRKLGRKLGKQMKAVAAALAGLSQPDILSLERNGSLSLTLPDGSQADVELADVEIVSEDIPGWLVANDGNLTVALDITLTDELIYEGIARELVNRIQNVRKHKGFDITDRVSVRIKPDERIRQAVEQFGDYIARQVLATEIVLAEVSRNDTDDIENDELNIQLTVDKV